MDGKTLQLTNVKFVLELRMSCEIILSTSLIRQKTILETMALRLLPVHSMRKGYVSCLFFESTQMAVQLLVIIKTVFIQGNCYIGIYGLQFNERL